MYSEFQSFPFSSKIYGRVLKESKEMISCFVPPKKIICMKQNNPKYSFTKTLSIYTLIWEVSLRKISTWSINYFYNPISKGRDASIDWKSDSFFFFFSVENPMKIINRVNVSHKQGMLSTNSHSRKVRGEWMFLGLPNQIRSWTQEHSSNSIIRRCVQWYIRLHWE